MLDHSRDLQTAGLSDTSVVFTFLPFKGPALHRKMAYTAVRLVFSLRQQGDPRAFRSISLTGVNSKGIPIYIFSASVASADPLGSLLCIHTQHAVQTAVEIHSTRRSNGPFA